MREFSRIFVGRRTGDKNTWSGAHLIYKCKSESQEISGEKEKREMREKTERDPAQESQE